MEQEQELQRLLNELKQDTGITFAVTGECEDGREATIAQLRKLVKSYRTGNNREYFLQRVLNGEVVSSPLYQDAKRFHINAGDLFRVFYIELCQEYDIDVQAILKSLFYPQTAIFVIPMSSSRFVVLKAVSKRGSEADAAKNAYMILDMLNTEAMLDARVAYGTAARQLEFLQDSYREARLAMEIGHIFYVRERVFAYDHLGIGRLIYELPVSVCKAYVKEVFGDNIPESLDLEMLTTINAFFDNGLNISETARNLYVHRNTLVYRLEKLQKTIGLDIRNFEDAMTYKIVVMAVDYIRYMEKRK